MRLAAAFLAGIVILVGIVDGAAGARPAASPSPCPSGQICAFPGESPGSIIPILPTPSRHRPRATMPPTDT